MIRFFLIMHYRDDGGAFFDLEVDVPQHPRRDEFVGGILFDVFELDHKKFIF